MKMAATHYSNKWPEHSAHVYVLMNAAHDLIVNRIESGVHVIRNPLDIIVSAYFSHRNTHSVEDWPELAKQRQVLLSAKEHEGMFLTLAFLERDDFYAGAVGPLYALRHWNFDDDRFPTLRMEDVVRNPDRLLGPILESHFSGSALPPESNHAFETMTGRQIGEIDEKSHYRSGKVDQWREALPAAVIRYVRVHFAGLLERFYPSSLQD